jgi:hypothetical protein
MFTAQIAKKNSIAVLAVSTLAAALAAPVSALAAAGAPQICEPNSTCVVGEFLYDDSYAPITTATCSFTSRDPSGNLVHNGVSMSVGSDGYYSNSFTAGSSEGIYRAQICCTAGTDYLCIDKTYEVKADPSIASSTDIASAVWGYSDRTLSSFGSLVTDIWSSTSRTLTNLITGDSGTSTTNTNIDNSSTSSSSSSSSTSALSNIVNLSNIQNLITQNRLLLEELINEPIIETTLEDDQAPDLSQKLNDTNTMASQIFANHQFVASKVGQLVSRWDTISESDAIDQVVAISNLVGDESDSGTDTIFGQINWMKKNWDWDLSDQLYEQTKLNKKALASVRNSLGSSGKTAYANLQLKSLLSYLDVTEKLIGDESNDSTVFTLFGKLAEVEKIASALHDRDKEADQLLSDLSTGKDGVEAKTDLLVKKVIAINKLPKISQVYTQIDKEKPEEIIYKNKLLASKGVIKANEKLLAGGVGKSFGVTWLEVGSFIFKSVITNPSKLIAQDAELKYFLPPEVAEENVEDVDDGVEVKYDTDTGKYFVNGKFSLDPEETVTVKVKVEDIFVITGEDIESLRKQTEELAKPLADTAFFAQSVTLTSDINASLDKIVTLQKGVITPEEQIRAFREAVLEIKKVDEYMGKLQDLVTQQSSTGSMRAFIGGAQTLAVWGLIIVMVTGFIFLVVYMRTLSVKDSTMKTKSKDKKHNDEIKFGKPKLKEGFVYPRVIRAAMPFVLVAVMSGTISAVVVKVSSNPKDNKVVEQNDQPKVVAEETETKDEEVLSESVESEDAALGGQELVKIVVPPGSKVNLREEPTLDSKVLIKLSETQEAVKLTEFNNWVNIVIENPGALEAATRSEDDDISIDAWVHSDFVESADDVEESINDNEDDLVPFDEVSIVPENANPDVGIGGVSPDVFDANSTLVIVANTPTGWLRIRNKPWGDEVERAVPGDVFEFVSEVGEWYEVKLASGTSGYIHSDYATIE